MPGNFPWMPCAPQGVKGLDDDDDDDDDDVEVRNLISSLFIPAVLQ
jgi:hypothetical protein